MANYQVGNLELNIITYANNATKSLGKMNDELKETKKTLKNTGIFATLGKWNYYINSARYYGRALSNIVQYAMDYVETQNLWQVANRNNIAQATEFIDKMSTAYGLSEATLMNYQAIFKNMLSALGGIDDILSSTLSQQMTQLALDFSSLYNVSIESAMTKFQAVLSGQVRPIRSISGYDITENTIFDIYQKAGGEKTMRQLSQIEKRLLRIYAVFGQMEGTAIITDESGKRIGDMEKTINSASNQARIMNEQLKETLMWSGQVILTWLNSIGVFQYVNAALITMKEIMKSLAFSSGYESQDFLDGLMTSAEDTNEEIKELQGLLSFDKFEALSSNQTNALGIDENILDLLDKIEVSMNDFEMEATKISNEWLKQIGLGKELYRITYNTGEVVLKTAEEYAKMTEAQKEGIVSIENYREMNGALNGTLTLLKDILIVIGGVMALGLLERIPKLIALLKGAANATALWNKVLLVGSIYVLFEALQQINNSNMSGILKLINMLIGLAAAITGIVIATKMLHLDWVGALSMGALVGAGVLTVLNAAPKFANGGFVDEGQLFIAREAGAEMVGTMGGHTAVANNDQIVEGIKQGVYEATITANSQFGGNNLSGDVILDGNKVGRLVAKGTYEENVRVGRIKMR